MTARRAPARLAPGATIIAAAIAVSALIAGGAAGQGSAPALVTARLSGDVAEQILAPPAITTLNRAETQLRALPGVASVNGPGTVMSAAVTHALDYLRQSVGPGLWGRAQRAAARQSAAQRTVGASAATVLAAADEERARAFGANAYKYQDALIRIGLAGYPTLDSTDFLDDTVLGSGTTPKPSMRQIFPGAASALVIVRLGAGASGAQRRCPLPSRSAPSGWRHASPAAPRRSGIRYRWLSC